MWRESRGQKGHYISMRTMMGDLAKLDTHNDGKTDGKGNASIVWRLKTPPKNSEGRGGVNSINYKDWHVWGIFASRRPWPWTHCLRLLPLWQKMERPISSLDLEPYTAISSGIISEHH